MEIESNCRRSLMEGVIRGMRQVMVKKLLFSEV